MTFSELTPFAATLKVMEMRKNNVSRQRIASHIGISSHAIRTIEKCGVISLSPRYKKKVLQWLKRSGRVLHGPEKVRGRKPNGTIVVPEPASVLLEFNGRPSYLTVGSLYKIVNETLYELVKV